MQAVKKVLFLAPHLSTGGMPQFLLKRIQALKQYTNYEIFVFEFRRYATQFIVQREQIRKLIPHSNFFTCGWDDFTEEKQNTLVNFIEDNNIDILHVEEPPEGFDSFNKFSTELQKKVYKKNRKYKIIESPHGMGFNPDKDKKFDPDAYAFVVNDHLTNKYKNKKAKMKTLIPYPIDVSIRSPLSREEVLKNDGWREYGEKHIVNIGLWTQGKNQGYALDIARSLWDKYKFTYIFHFIGNQASNFKKYWEPITKDLPENVIIHGERDNVDEFYKMADLMLFTSTWECNPVVLKEAISNNLRIMAYNLPHYGDEYVPFIDGLTGNSVNDENTLLKVINTPVKYDSMEYSNGVKEFAQQHIELYKSLLNGGSS